MITRRLALLPKCGNVRYVADLQGEVLTRKCDKRGSQRGRRTMRLNVCLRTPHVHYLEDLAEQTGMSVSGAFGSIVEKHAFLALMSYKPPRKEEKYLTIEPGHADILTRLATQQGLYKADIARRLIEAAMAGDEVVGG